MPIYLIDKIAALGGGNFPMVDALAVTGGTGNRLRDITMPQFTGDADVSAGTVDIRISKLRSFPTSGYVRTQSDGTIWIDTSTPGAGGDAGTLDGYDSTYFAVATGYLNLAAGGLISGATTYSGLAQFLNGIAVSRITTFTSNGFLYAASGNGSLVLDDTISTGFLRRSTGGVISGDVNISGNVLIKNNLVVTGNITSSGQFISPIAIGTSPFSVVSTTVNTNLNADLLDGQHGSYYATTQNTLKIDQTTPQFVINGTPVFSGGIRLGNFTTSGFLKTNAVGTGSLFVDTTNYAISTGYLNLSTGGVVSGNLAVSGNLGVSGTTTISGQIVSPIPVGTSPFNVTSTTLNTNLNADYLDGQHASGFALATGFVSLSIATSQTIIGQLKSTLATGTSPFDVLSSTVNSNLNADMVDGVHAASFSLVDGTRAFTGTVSGVMPTVSAHLATKEYVDLVSLHVDISEFFSSTASDIGGIYYVMDDVEAAAGTVSSSAISSATTTNVFNFATLVGSPHLIRIEAGIIDIHAHLKHAKGAGSERTCVAYCELYKRSGVTETLLGTSANSDNINGDNTDRFYDMYMTISTEVSLDVTDRLVLKWYVITGTGTATCTVTMTVGGTADPHMGIGVPSTELTGVFVPYTGAEDNVNLGTKTMSGANYTSTVATGTSPYACLSSTVNSNLNSDYVDGLHASSFALATGFLSLSVVTVQTIASQLKSTLATGIAPFDVLSSTVNANLNADMVDGIHASTFAIATGYLNLSTGGTVSGGVSISGQITSPIAVGTSPFNVTSTTVNTNLNADMVDGQHASNLLWATGVKCTDFSIINPSGAYGVDTQVPIMYTRAATTITKIITSLNVTTSQVSGDLMFADNLTSFTSSTIISGFDTTNGVSTVTTFNDATVPANKWIYVQWDVCPPAAVTFQAMHIEWNYD